MSPNPQSAIRNFLLLLVPTLAWVGWLAWKSDVQLSPWRRWVSGILRVAVLLLVVLALAGWQWMRPIEGMNVFFLLDRSDSIPEEQQAQALATVTALSKGKEKVDKGGVIVFGTDAAIEFTPNSAVALEKVLAVVDTERTDLSAAIRLGTAGFPEMGQKRLVIFSDGNENIGDALAAVRAAKPLGVTVDVWPLGVRRANDIAVQKLGIPQSLKKGAVFESKIFVQADHPTPATIRLYRNDVYLGEQQVNLDQGKNLLTFPQKLEEPGFYNYDVRVEARSDVIPQNNRATGFTFVRGDPRALVISSDQQEDGTLVQALRSAKLDVTLIGANEFPASLAELQSYDVIFLCNLSSGDLGLANQKLLDSAVLDFGVGVVCIGGDNSYTAGGYRGTPLETMLPLSMELESKKVLPSGAVVLVMHGMEFMNGNQIARDCALGVLGALGPQDELGVVLWDGTERWLFPLEKVGDKKAAGRAIAGMNQGDLGSFQGVMTQAYEALKKSRANLKHIIVFSDGDPGPPSDALMSDIVKARITASSVLIAGHAGPEIMIRIADQGRGRFYNVTSAEELPQIFLKETAVILKSAIYEEPFKPQLRPLMAHWQRGLGRVVAFTSDAKPRWAKSWLAWERYQQFWVQVAQWSLRRLENAEFSTDVSLENGEGVISVDALDAGGNYRNFLQMAATVVSPKGERQTVALRQSGPGRYEAVFPTREPGTYAVNVMEVENGKVVAQQTAGASINYSPEFASSEPNQHLLRLLADTGGGRVLDPYNPGDNPYQL
ncbi:MAG: VWA domain-containing protein, partial [Verrucomicrobia bacterium]|nr:VWA domain-containing protein [Verrucomicrobiota bacterium]